MPPTSASVIARSAILRGDSPTTGLRALPSNNPNQANRVVGALADGRQIMVALRGGKGGMDFNKLLTGKVYAVAADGLTKSMVKDAAGNPTKEQKTEEGLPLYIASGLYLMSSKEYMALYMSAAYARLFDDGATMAIMTTAQVNARQSLALAGELEWDLFTEQLLALLSDEHNLMAPYAGALNKSRGRDLRRAKEDAEEAGLEFKGPQFAELGVSKKDGNPFVLLSFADSAGRMRSHLVTRHVELMNEDDGRLIPHFLTPEEALAHFEKSDAARYLKAASSEGRELTLTFAQGHILRSSVSQRRKIENLRTLVKENPNKPLYGDNAFLNCAMQGWVKALVSAMYSKHPQFPAEDYDVLHFVGTCRQAEMAMQRSADGKGWLPPSAPRYDVATMLPAKELAVA